MDSSNNNRRGPTATAPADPPLTKLTKMLVAIFISLSIVFISLIL